jgi:LAS superfamily LD-carboxypeptidase LdcB
MMVQTWHNGAPSTVKVVEIVNTRDGVAMYLTPEAAAAWAEMCKDALENHGITLIANSAWRSFDHQKRIFSRWEEKLDQWRRNGSQGRPPPRPASPGKSKHHNGVAIDIQRSHDDPDGDGPEIGKTDAYLRENAHRFGFAQPYPKNEPWHFEHH